MFDISKAWPDLKVVEKLGEGSFGKVYKCEREEFGIKTVCAVKVISIPQSQAEIESMSFEGVSAEGARTYYSDVVNDFANEIKLMEMLKGAPNIVNVENFRIIEREDEIGWDIYIRMEYLQSFVSYSKNKKFTEEEVKKFALDISNALAICSKNGVIHRDIKPDNIFVDKFGSFKLGDFGVARKLEGTMSVMSKKGTYSYMAPEVFKGEKYDARADIYSLGMVMYKLLNRNRDPLVDMNAPIIGFKERNEAIDRRRSGERLPAPVDASPSMAAVILKACEFRAEDRYESVEEFREAISALQFGELAEEPTLSARDYFDQTVPEKYVELPTIVPVKEDLGDATIDVNYTAKDEELTLALPDDITEITANEPDNESTVIAADEPTVIAETDVTVNGDADTAKTAVFSEATASDVNSEMTESVNDVETDMDSEKYLSENSENVEKDKKKFNSKAIIAAIVAIVVVVSVVLAVRVLPRHNNEHEPVFTTVENIVDDKLVVIDEVANAGRQITRSYPYPNSYPCTDKAIDDNRVFINNGVYLFNERTKISALISEINAESVLFDGIDVVYSETKTDTISVYKTTLLNKNTEKIFETKDFNGGYTEILYFDDNNIYFMTFVDENMMIIPYAVYVYNLESMSSKILVEFGEGFAWSNYKCVDNYFFYPEYDVESEVNNLVCYNFSNQTKATISNEAYDGAISKLFLENGYVYYLCGDFNGDDSIYKMAKSSLDGSSTEYVLDSIPNYNYAYLNSEEIIYCYLGENDYCDDYGNWRIGGSTSVNIKTEDGVSNINEKYAYNIFMQDGKMFCYDYSDSRYNLYIINNDGSLTLCKETGYADFNTYDNYSIDHKSGYDNVVVSESGVYVYGFSDNKTFQFYDFRDVNQSETELEYDDSWKEAYVEVLRNVEREGQYSFWLGYVDDNDIPELFISEGWAHFQGVDVYSYNKGKAVLLCSDGQFGGIGYIERKGYICAEYQGMGVRMCNVYEVKDGTVEVIFETYDDSGNGGDTLTINGESNFVMDYEMQEFYDKYYGLSLAGYGETEEYDFNVYDPTEENYQKYIMEFNG